MRRVARKPIRHAKDSPPASRVRQNDDHSDPRGHEQTTAARSAVPNAPSHSTAVRNRNRQNASVTRGRRTASGQSRTSSGYSTNAAVSDATASRSSARVSGSIRGGSLMELYRRHFDQIIEERR